MVAYFKAEGELEGGEEKLGDLNGDGAINGKDANLLKVMISGNM